MLYLLSGVIGIFTGMYIMCAIAIRSINRIRQEHERRCRDCNSKINRFNMSKN